MEVTKAEIDAVLDAQGRFVWTPNALTLDGQRNVPCDLQVGESLLAFLRRHVPGIESGGWSVSIGGAVVPRRMWAKTFPKHGMHIACRAVVGKQVVAIVAIAALTYFSAGMAAGLYGALGGTYVMASAGMTLAMIQSGIVLAGSLLINKVLGPKVPKAGEVPAARQVYSLSGQRNSARAYEPLPVLWGEMRVTPDLASQPYAWYESDDQYLSVILLGGVNVHSASDLSVGDTPIGNYDDVQVYFDGFAGMASQKVPLFSNADTLPGGQLDVVDPSAALAWTTRTSSVDTVRLAVDFEYTLWFQGNKGIRYNEAYLYLEYRRKGTSAWTAYPTQRLKSSSTSPKRRTISIAVAQGQYEVRMAGRKIPKDGSDLGGTRDIVWAALRSIQPDTTDYSQWGRIAVRIRATGQLSGSLDTLRATYRAKPMPVWNGTQWVTATDRSNGLSNPGAIILQTLRGVRDAKGRLQFGYGLQDEQIDIEGLKAFMLYCRAKGFTYDRWITSSMSLQEFCQEVALAGMGEFSWTDGSRPTVVFVSEGQPVSAVVNMANMLKASFSVNYTLSNVADGIEYQYVDRTKNFETVTLRVSAPGVATPLNPARIKGEGVTNEAHAAVMARYHLAQSLYQYKTIGFGADIEHLDYRRLSLLSVSHDLTQWGFGGRLEGISVGNGYIQVQLGEAVPALSTPKLGLRLPGGRDYRVWPVQEFTGESDTLILLGDWPDGVPVPGATESDPVHDTLWCYDFKATPGYRVRVTGIEPEGDLKGAKVTCVPEGAEFWDYVLNGNYVPAPNQSALPQLARPAVQGLRVSEQTNVQGNTRWWQLSAVWDVQGAADHCQVWAGLDGSELVLVDASATGNRSSWRIDEPGEYLVQVRPFDASGRAGDAASVLYVTAGVALPPANASNFVVQELAGGLRRFAWSFAGDVPVAFAGVQIRYAEGDTTVSAASWDELTPLGDAGDVYTAQFETTKPAAGVHTFALRTVNTSGQLSSGVLRFVANLASSFEQVQQPDVTPPPAPPVLAATGAFATVQVSWDVPVYDQGHGHSRTEVWAGVTADIADAAKVAEAYAGPASFEWTLGSTAYVWARHVTNDGVAGDWAGPVTAQTAQDVAALGEVLKGQITQSQLHADLSGRVDMIDVLDVGRPELGVATGLIQATAVLAAADVQKRDEIDAAARQALEALLIADRALERITDAGVYVDPDSGTVKIAGLEATRDEVTQLEVLLDAVQGQLALKATTAYVDGRIAEAVLSPADLLLYEGLDARVTSVTQALNSVNGQLAQKASAAELTQALVRLTTAESNLDALTGQIALRVTRSEWEAAREGLENRLTSAEVTLSSIDAPSIAQTVMATRRLDKSADKAAEALLRDILTGEKNREDAAAALAFAKTELSAAITDGLQAEAQQRTQLAAQVGTQLAALEQTASAQADQLGYASLQYSVRGVLSAGGKTVMGGFGLSGRSDAEAGPTLDFGVLANRFFIAAPTGSGIESDFQLTVQTAPSTANGVTIPPGLYVDSAYITNVNALWGRFGTLVADSIQATAISASQLTAGNGVIGGSLKSSNYVSGSSGWTLRPDGVAEFSGVIVRGTVYATSGTVGGWSIGGNYLRSSNYAAGVRGVSFGSDGSVEIRSADGARVFNLQAAGAQPLLSVPGLSILGNGSATFSGNLSGASGSFSGTLTADNVVNTSHMVDGAASAGVSVYLAGEVTFSNYDTQVEVASVAFNGSGGRVLALVGLGISASGGVTSSRNPLIRVRLLRNGGEVRRIDVPAEMYTVSHEGGTSTYSRVTGAAFTLPPLTDSPGVGWHTYSVTVEARQMGTSVSVTARQRGLAILEMKR